jgi:hypothetical protein
MKHNKTSVSKTRFLPILLAALHAAIFTGEAACADASVSVEESHASLKNGRFKFNPALAGVHPRLVCSPEELKNTIAEWGKNRGKYTSLADERGFASVPLVPMNAGLHGWDIPRRMLLSATLWLMTGESHYAEVVHRWIQKSYAPVFVENPQPVDIPALGVGNNDLSVGGLLYSTALMYDLLYSNKDYQKKYPGDIDILEKTLLVQGAQTYRDLDAIMGLWYEQNHFYIAAGGLGMAALALSDKAREHPEIADWAVWSRNAMRRTAEALSGDGFYYEGIGYWNGFFQYATAYAEALWRMTGEDLRKPSADGAPGLFTGLAEYLAHVRLSEAGKFFPYGDHGPREAYTGYRFFMSDLKVPLALPAALQMAEIAPSPLVRHIISGGWKDRGAFNLLFVDALESTLVLLKLPVLAKNLETDPKIAEVPAWHYFANHDVIFWRNGWTGKNASAGTHLLFKAGPPEGHKTTALLKKYPDWKMGMGHVHQDAGTFQIFARGGYLVTAPGYSGEKKTEHHSCVLIDGKGQYKEGTAWDSFAHAPYSKYDPMRFEEAWLSSQVVAATAIIEAAYDDALRLEHYHRQLIMVGGRWLVIRDSIAAPDAHTFTWVLNSDRPFVPDYSGAGDRWYSDVSGGRIIVQSLVPLEDSTTGPTLINVDLFGQRPEYVTRAQHLKLHLPATKECEILTALCIQDRWRDKPESFVPAVAGKGVVEINEGGQKCTIYVGRSERLDGAYGFAWSAPGEVSFGISGKSLVLPDGKMLTLDYPGKVTLTLKASRCKIESDMAKAGSLKISENGKTITTMQLPAGNSTRTVDLKL